MHFHRQVVSDFPSGFGAGAPTGCGAEPREENLAILGAKTSIWGAKNVKFCVNPWKNLAFLTYRDAIFMRKPTVHGTVQASLSMASPHNFKGL